MRILVVDTAGNEFEVDYEDYAGTKADGSFWDDTETMDEFFRQRWVWGFRLKGFDWWALNTRQIVRAAVDQGEPHWQEHPA